MSKAVNINALNKKELANYIPQMAKGLPHQYIKNAQLEARKEINQFIYASIRLSSCIKKEADET